jgi:hypothetical protein
MRIEPESPMCTSGWRIVRFSCFGHNDASGWATARHPRIAIVATILALSRQDAGAALA